MKRPLTSTPGVVLLAFLVAGFVAADQPATPPQQQPFTAVELDRFIRDWPRFVAWAGSRGAPAGSGEVPGSPAASREIAQYLRVRGWEPDRFFYIAGNTTAGLLAAQMNEQTPEVARELEQQRSIIRQSPDLTGEQKAELIESLDQPSTADSPPGIPASEMILIRSRRQQLQHALDPAY